MLHKAEIMRLKHSIYIPKRFYAQKGYLVTNRSLGLTRRLNKAKFSPHKKTTPQNQYTGWFHYLIILISTIVSS